MVNFKTKHISTCLHTSVNIPTVWQTTINWSKVHLINVMYCKVWNVAVASRHFHWHIALEGAVIIAFKTSANSRGDETAEERLRLKNQMESHFSLAPWSVLQIPTSCCSSSLWTWSQHQVRWTVQQMEETFNRRTTIKTSGSKAEDSEYVQPVSH